MKISNADKHRWHKDGINTADENGDLAVNRLNNPVLQMFADPSASLSKNSSFFMIGSCFARGLESALTREGFEVLSLTDEFSRWRAINDKVKPVGVTNRYNTGSILNDFRWALDPERSFPEDAYVAYDSEKFIDLHMNPQLPPASIAELRERRKIWSNVTAKLKNVDVVTITLGLVEVWEDEKLNLICNTTPDGRVTRKNPGRFTFKTLGFAENLSNLKEIHHLMSMYGAPGHRIIVTVSPVPLARTFTRNDVIHANTYSKSVLRAVAEEFVDAYENVDYFPSYEIAMNSQHNLVWADDKRHVKGGFANMIMEQFTATYFGDTC